VDPVVTGLGQIAWREIDQRRKTYHVPQLLLDAALDLRSPDGKTYRQRIDGAKTERHLSAVFEDFVAQVPLGEKLFGGYNPVRTLGSMQVSIDFIEEYARQRPFPLSGRSSLRAAAFSRRGGIYFGTAHLLDYPAPYDEPIYRFADYNAGRYASRNAAFQSAVSIVAGIRLDLDGALVNYRQKSSSAVLSDTSRLALSLAPQLGLDERQIMQDLQYQRSADFETTSTYRRVFSQADKLAGVTLPRAILPQIKLSGPKISRNNLSTAWFAGRVNTRYGVCLSRNGSSLR